jgi:transposase
MSDKRKKKFKAYDPDQGMLLPPYLDDLIPEKHLVRVINRVMNSIRVENLYGQFKDLGCSSYHPLMMLKVIVYGYCQKIYSNRRIAQAMRQDVTFMWLSGMQTPGFRTVGRFRSEYLKDLMEDVFTDVLDLLHREKYVKFETYFVDGTLIEADANKHSHVWTKNTDRYKKAVKERVHGLLDEIERINKEEDSHYGEQDLEEMGEDSTLTSEKVLEVSDRINKKLEEKQDQKQTSAERKVRSVAGKLAKESENLAKYEE